MRKQQLALAGPPGWSSTPSTLHPSSTRRLTGKPNPKEVLFARLHAKVLNQSRIISEPQSQIGALCISPNSQLAYKLTKVLQSAIYGGVFLADVYYIAGVLFSKPGQTPQQSQPKVAIKIMLRDVALKHKDNLQENITAEIQFQEYMKGHPNVLMYQELWESKTKGIVYVVMPYAEFEDLFEVMKKRRVPLSESEARWLFRQLLSGTIFLHQREIGFRDHSLENILLFRGADGHTLLPKITDPGQAIKLKRDVFGNVLDQCALKFFGKSFRPPEIYSSSRTYNPIKVDSFCLGWMLFFVVTKRQPFDRALDIDPHWPLVKHGRLNELLKIKGNQTLSSELIDLLSRMMQQDYRFRPSPQECLKHRWFSAGPDTPLTDLNVRGPSTL